MGIQIFGVKFTVFNRHPATWVSNLHTGSPIWIVPVESQSGSQGLLSSDILAPLAGQFRRCLSVRRRRQMCITMDSL